MSANTRATKRDTVLRSLDEREVRDALLGESSSDVESSPPGADDVAP